MISINEVIKTVNAVITKNAGQYFCGIALGSQVKPQYNNGGKIPKVCSMNLQCCKKFYEDFDSTPDLSAICPVGFTVKKRVYETKTRYQTIKLFAIVDYHVSDQLNALFNDLPRDLKKVKDDVILELTALKIQYPDHEGNRVFIESLLETLLIGRIGVAIQAISHEFFTPMQGAMSDVKNIQEQIDVQASSSRLAKNLNTLNQLATEVQLLLSTSEEFNTNMLRKVPVHVMVNDIIADLQPYAAEKNLQLRQGFNSFNKAVEAIPGQLKIVLNNIIRNALKYSFSGFPETLFEVAITYDSDDKYLIIQVHNEGCKIEQSEIEDRSLFNLGYRGIHSGDRKRPGTGTGLYIADQIVRAHGGSIEVGSHRKGGNEELNTDRYQTTFYIHWPFYYE